MLPQIHELDSGISYTPTTKSQSLSHHWHLHSDHQPLDVIQSENSLGEIPSNLSLVYQQNFHLV